MFNEKLVDQLARELIKAEDTCVPIKLFSEKYPNITVEDSYNIQNRVIELKVERGEKIIGKKIGLTSRGIREQLGVFEPDYGSMTDKGLLFGKEELDLSKLIEPRIEAEIVFVLKEDLKGPVVTAWDVISATEGVMPALEVVDTRFDSWKFKIFDTVADSASYARLVVGNKMTKIDDLDLSIIGMASYKNGELINTASSAEVMGNPVNSVVWLANKMLEFGNYLKKGEVILSGSLTPVFSIEPGDNVNVIFDRIGNVTLKAKNNI